MTRWSTAPACCLMGAPRENTMKLGMLCTWNRRARSGCASVSTFSTTALPASSVAARCTSGATMRHGPHHSAQKSTSTGTRACWMMSSNSSMFAFNGTASGAIALLQRPQRPWSARWRAGIRFSAPQFGQTRIIGRKMTTQASASTPRDRERPRARLPARGPPSQGHS